jgi:hypothetical protein
MSAKAPGYDGTTAHSPDPGFRKLTDRVDIQFADHGEPGSVTVAAELPTSGAWRSTQASSMLPLVSFL